MIDWRSSGARGRRVVAWGAALAVVLTLGSGCAKRPPPDPDLGQAVAFIAEDLTRQLGLLRGNRTVVFDPLLDGASGEQTAGTEIVQRRLGPALEQRARGVRVLAFDGEGAATADLVATGTLTALDGDDAYRLVLALSDQRSGLVVAQAAVRFRQPELDTTPTPFYEESPSLVRDRSVEGYLKTAETPAGQPADPLYISQLPTAALLAEALAAYNADDWESALAFYQAAAERPDGQQMRTFNGLYLSHLRLDQRDEARAAFGQIVTLGLATNNLAIKLLFRPGSTDYWPDRRVSGVYPMWLGQIARAVDESDACLEVIGHTSRSGTAAYNDQLSLARARRVQTQLDAQVPGLRRRMRASGRGFRDNIVGTGADDATDALDRRAEFRVVPCP